MSCYAHWPRYTKAHPLDFVRPPSSENHRQPTCRVGATLRSTFFFA